MVCVIGVLYFFFFFFFLIKSTFKALEIKYEKGKWLTEVES